MYNWYTESLKLIEVKTKSPTLCLRKKWKEEQENDGKIKQSVKYFNIILKWSQWDIILE